MRKVLKLSLFLLIVASIAGFSISYVNGITDPLIEQQNAEKKQSSFNDVYPGADDVKDESKKYITNDSDEVVKEVNIAYKSNIPVGVIYTVKPNGYNGKIEMLVGFDINSKKITAIKILSQSETPGLGANSKESFFSDRFKGLNAESSIEIVKKESVQDNEVLAITAATITSKAVASGVNVARQHFISNFAK
ncbi:MAG: RnfABCDGE type electron transport complex subunit G [Clostridia bacterium]|nr:RnfABCDGE type electron transport complex subunit G [Clostridia bacterium]MDD4048345.1 RnfABCDGE type electron transport complex subunit G [Clostridia bacterium]